MSAELDGMCEALTHGAPLPILQKGSRLDNMGGKDIVLVVTWQRQGDMVVTRELGTDS
ncbi:hypothetical protein GCM10023228_25740 [Brevibacillus fulvus]|uniref:Uncharacterized protein n=1 Tax=Brevibacillus fulvus TaxID=1125967 RepID=A0A939BTJ7_9BACL|nr:hypothetical protein [Brevibacillus fulvus]